MEKENVALYFGIIVALVSGMLAGFITAITVYTLGFENMWIIAFPIGVFVLIIVLPLWTIAWLLRQDV